jgi:hemerythrin-like domain-containing protein
VASWHDGAGSTRRTGHLKVSHTQISNKDIPQPEIGGDLIRVHGAITRAVGVAKSETARFIADGFPDNQILKGYLTYVRCLVKLLHAHHVTEDKGMFPYLRPKIPNAPYEELMKQHSAMGPLIHDIQANLRTMKTGNPTQPLQHILDALQRTSALWQEHIHLEEAHFGLDALDSVLSMQERRKAGRITASQSARHQFPLSLMVPFLLYNMPPADREIMVQLMPPFIPPLLTLWKPQWRIMTPFLLPDV